MFAIPGLGDRKPSEHMEMMLGLLGTEEPNFLFIELFLRHMPPRVQTALANTSITEPRALAEEADRFFLATQRSTPELLAPTRSFPPDQHADPEVLAPTRSYAPTGRDVQTKKGLASAIGGSSSGMCYYHARFGAKASKCRSPCTYAAGNGKACAL